MAGLDRFLKSAKKIQEDRKQNRSADSPKHEATHDESNWLMSYADMMTLLCGFFILLFSMAKLDQPKYEKAKEELAKQFHGEYINQPQQMADHFTYALREINVQKGVVVKPDATGVSIVFESTLFFDTLNASVRPEGREILAHLINSVEELQKKDSAKFRIVVEGHTDSRPITGGMFPSNWELSAARAASVVRMFLDHGFDSDRLAAVGYADTHPVALSRTPAGAWDEAALAKNRRVVVRILEPRVDSIPIPSDRVEEAAAPAQAPAATSAPAHAAAAIAAPTAAGGPAPASVTAPAPVAAPAPAAPAPPAAAPATAAPATTPPQAAH